MKNLTEQQIDGNEEFLVGDQVVLTPNGTRNVLLEIVDYKYTNDLYRVKVLSTGSHGPIHRSQIRHATIAEINARRRLNSIEQALGEVS